MSEFIAIYLRPPHALHHPIQPTTHLSLRTRKKNAGSERRWKKVQRAHVTKNFTRVYFFCVLYPAPIGLKVWKFFFVFNKIWLCVVCVCVRYWKEKSFGVLKKITCFFQFFFTNSFLIVLRLGFGGGGTFSLTPPHAVVVCCDNNIQRQS